MIALDFPKFSDGRAYTQARLLRERFGYRGELRATGNVLRDQLLFMLRCGFDAFETGDQVTAEVVERSLASFSLAYQPAADGRPSVIELRHARAAGVTKAATDKSCIGGHDRCTAGYVGIRGGPVILCGSPDGPSRGPSSRSLHRGSPTARLLREVGRSDEPVPPLSARHERYRDPAMAQSALQHLRLLRRRPRRHDGSRRWIADDAAFDRAVRHSSGDSRRHRSALRRRHQDRWNLRPWGLSDHRLADRRPACRPGACRRHA